MDSNTSVQSTEPSPHNPKYAKLPGEFYDEKHKVLWNVWTSKAIVESVAQFKFRPDDVVLATFPKSGTTLAQEILWLLHNNVDTEKAKEMPVYVRVPFLELQSSSEDEFETRDHIHVLNESSEKMPRLIKTHLPLRYIEAALAETQTKVINIMRNPKDTMASYFHFYQGVDDYGPWKGEWNDFFEMWMEGHLVAGDWFEVTSEWWRSSLAPKFPQKLLFFEDFLCDPDKQIQAIADFCGCSLDAAQLQTIMEHTKFDKMKSNPSTNYSTMPGVNFQFMRKGKIGDWRNHFSEVQSRQFDEAYKARMIGCEGLQFQYE